VPEGFALPATLRLILLIQDEYLILICTFTLRKPCICVLLVLHPYLFLHEAALSHILLSQWFSFDYTVTKNRRIAGIDELEVEIDITTSSLFSDIVDIYRDLHNIWPMYHFSSCHRHYPLPSHPEFSVIDYSGYREYRVENRKLVITGKTRKWSSYVSSCFIVGSLSIGYRIVQTSLLLYK